MCPALHPRPYHPNCRWHNCWPGPCYSEKWDFCWVAVTWMFNCLGKAPSGRVVCAPLDKSTHRQRQGRCVFINQKLIKRWYTWPRMPYVQPDTHKKQSVSRKKSPPVRHCIHYLLLCFSIEFPWLSDTSRSSLPPTQRVTTNILPSLALIKK